MFFKEVERPGGLALAESKKRVRYESLLPTIHPGAGTGCEQPLIGRRVLDETGEFTLTIGNEALCSRRVRFQDAGEDCLLRLRRELAFFGNHPPNTLYGVGETNLDDYRSSHTTKAWGYPYKPEVSRDA